MKKVYVIGVTESNTNALEEIKKTIGHVGHGVEIICVNNIEEVPFKERLKSDMPVIQQIYELKAPPILPTACFVDKKRKSHERPYKFHK